MSRIILTEYDNGEHRFVVGWDHPAGGAFWQEFSKQPDPDPETGEVDWVAAENDGWVEVARYGGMFPGIPLNKFRDAVPEDLRPLVTDVVMDMLRRDSYNSNSGSVIRRWTAAGA